MEFKCLVQVQSKSKVSLTSHCWDKGLNVQCDTTCLRVYSRRKICGVKQPVLQETSSLVVIFVMFCNVPGFFMQFQATATIKEDYAMS